jgi:hypothetical protein
MIKEFLEVVSVPSDGFGGLKGSDSSKLYTESYGDRPINSRRWRGSAVTARGVLEIF